MRESPAKQIVSKVMQGCNNSDILIVEPNVEENNVYKLTQYQEAFNQADIVVYLVAHTPFKSLPKDTNKIILDFCGINR